MAREHRELQNITERAVILSHASALELAPELIPVPAAPDSADIRQNPSEDIQISGPESSTPPTLEALERAHIAAVLNQTRGVVEGPRGAAKILGLHPNTLRHRMQKLGLKRSAHHES